jgi:DNA-binding FrmR family transcriptional regulator
VIDILTQISSLIAASEEVAAILLEVHHVEHCVKESIGNREEADEEIEEFISTVERSFRV